MAKEGMTKDSAKKKKAPPKKPKKPKKASAKQLSPTLPDVDAQKKRMAEVLRVLKRSYPEAECRLTYSNPFELLVATVLSAQCTDDRVNATTPELFQKLGSPDRMAAASVKEIETLIKSINFFRNKATALKECSRALVDEHGGEVPRELDKLVALRGVGRKTANVVLGNAYGIPGLVVDTHVGRVSRRLGFTRSEDPVEVEHDLMPIVPREDWTDYAHLLIAHGRAVCTARVAKCEECPIVSLCLKVGVGYGGRC